MRAAIWYGPGDIRVETVSEPKHGSQDLLLQVLCCNICGSDLRTYLYGSSSIKPGTVLGHEFAGRVVEAPSTSPFVKGDIVTAAQDIPCGECWYCTHDMEHVCQNKLEFGKHFQGALAELLVVPEIVLRKGWVKKIPKGMSLNAASLIEPVSSCLHTSRLAPSQANDMVVIIGAGPIGCIHGEIAKHAGATVVLADISSTRLELARRFGFDVYVNSGAEGLDEVVHSLRPEGADKVISANPSPEALVEAVRLVRKGGIVVAFGGLPKGRASVPLDINRIHYDEVKLIGSYAYSRKENEEAFALVRDNVIHADMYVTSVKPLDRIVEGMNEAKEARALKVQISCQ